VKSEELDPGLTSSAVESRRDDEQEGKTELANDVARFSAAP